MKKTSDIITVLFLWMIVSAGGVLADEDTLRLANTYLRQKMFDEAVVAYKKVLAANPEDVNIRLNYARALAGNKLYERAITQYQQILDQSPGQMDAIKELGGIWEQLERYDKVNSLYKRSAQNYPRNRELRLLLAEAYFQNDKIEQAIAEYKNVLGEEQNNVHSYIGLGKSYYKKGQYKPAKDYFEKAKIISKDNADIFVGLGRIYLDRADYAQAIKELKEAENLEKNDFKINYLLATAYLKDENYEQAIAEFRRTLKKNYNNFQVRFDLANVYLHTGKYKEAIAVLKPVPETEYFIYQKNLLLAFASGAVGDFEAFWKYLKKIKIILFSLIIILILLFAGICGAIGLLFLWVFLSGKKVKEKDILFTHVRWGLPEIFLICMVLLILPLITGMVIGRICYHNWFLMFAPSHLISSHSVQTALWAQIISVVLTCSLVFLVIFGKNKQQWEDIGIKTIGIFRLLKLSFFSVIVIFLFSFVYMWVFVLFSGHPPEAQFISKVISTSKDMRKMLPLFLFVVVIGPVIEEIIFRGFIFTGLRRYSNFPTAAIVSALLFGIFHFQLNVIIPITFMGFVFAMLFERTRSVFPSIITHLAWNFLFFGSIFFRD